MLSTNSWSSKSSQRFLRISAIHHNMAHFISESTVHEYQYSIDHFPETSSLMSSGTGTNYDFSIWYRSSGHCFLMLFVELGKEDVTVIQCGLSRNDDFD